MPYHFGMCTLIQRGVVRRSVQEFDTTQKNSKKLTGRQTECKVIAEGWKMFVTVSDCARVLQKIVFKLAIERIDSDENFRNTHITTHFLTAQRG